MAFTINRRYRVEREITGEGSTSRVLLVDDILRGRRACALKLRRAPSGHDLSGARREFENLRSLRHPLIAEVFDFGRVEEVDPPPSKESPGAAIALPGDLFITFSYFDGLDLRAAFLKLFPPGEERALEPAEREARWRIFYRALADIGLGLQAIHSRGLVHHDIKPQNLLLAPRGSGPAVERFEVKIIDLDLAEPETTPLGGRMNGTLPFVAPEVLSGAFADQRSDLYSLGISIIWALSGRSPFPGSPEEVVRAIQAGPLSDLEELCAAAPSGLREVIGRLASRRMEERFPDAAALVEELGRLGGFTRSLERTFRAEVPLVGCERELALLTAEVEALAIGESERAAVLLESEPGSFADHLLEEMDAAAQLQGVKCITGRARAPALYPYHPISEVIQKIIPLIDFQAARYRRFLAPLSLFVPGLEPQEGSGPAADPGREQLRFFDAVAEFLLQAGREAPFLLCLRNLEHSDGETWSLIGFLARNIALRRRLPEDEALFAGTEGGAGEIGKDLPAAPPVQPSRLLLVASYEERDPAQALYGTPALPVEAGLSVRFPPQPRQVETPDGFAELSAQPYCLKIKLKHLGQERVGEWISRRLPGLRPSTRLVQKIHEKSSGVPRLLDEIVRRLPQGNGSSLEELEAVIRLPDSLPDACMERLSRLGEEDRALLDLLAAAQAPLPLALLARALPALLRAVLLRGSGPPAGEIAAPGEADLLLQVRRLVDEGFLLVAEERGGLSIGWATGSLREHGYRQLPDERRLCAHRAILETLLEGGSAQADLLSEEAAFHAQRAGRLGLFVRFARKAARIYRRAHAVEPAIRLLEEVLSILDPLFASGEELPEGMSRDVLRWSVHGELGEIYQGRRNFPRALEKYTVLLSLEGAGGPGGGEPLRRAEIYRKMGEVYGENRDPSNALLFLEKSLELVSGEPVSRVQVETLLSLAEFHLARGQLERAETAALRALDSLERFSAADLRCRTHCLLGTIAGKSNDHPRSLSMHLRALEELSGSEDWLRIAEVTGALGEGHMARGQYEKATERFSRGIELAERVGSKHLLGLFYTQLGTIHFNRANHYQALEYFRRSLCLRRELGDLRGVANSYNNLGLVFLLRDDLTRASECYRRSIDIFARIDDQYGMAAGMNNLANILELEGKYNEALEYSFRSLEKRKRFNSKTGIAFSYYRMGKIYQSKGELDKALTFAEKSLSIRRELGEKMGMAYSHLQLAELYLLAGRPFESFQECQRGQKEFEHVENDLGRLLARHILARILLQVGILDEATQILHETLAQFREGKQQLMVGAALLDLGRVSIEEGKLREAEAHLSRAEALHRENRNRREHAEALLWRCALALELSEPERASLILEDAYTILEELGIRDLVPRYFLLRGRIEGQTAGGSSDRARKFLERGLVEAREVHLPDLSWRLHFRLALLLKDRGEPALARSHAAEAETILNGQFDPLPLRFKERFFLSRERAELRKLVEELAVSETEAGREPGKEEPAPLQPTSRQLEEIRSLNKQLLKLQEVGQAITSELDLHRLLEKLMDTVLELVNAERGFLILRTPESETDTITVARNLDREMVDKPELKISRSISDEVIRTARPVLSTSALDDERFSGSKSVHNLRLQSILCVPLLLREKVLGAIYLDNRLRRHAFSEDDLRVLLTFCAQAAIAITNARLSEEIQRRNHELTEANRQMAVLNQRLVEQVNERTAELSAAREHLRRRQSEVEPSHRFHKLVGKSKRMHEIFHILDRISTTALPVLIMGESGTGKELIANAIHQASTRREQRFISENCAALSETLLESELFGHTRGAFTGAVSERKGLFELAHGGTLFLDEVGDMSLAMQKKLLRVLQEGEIRRVGGKDTIRVDARIISASNQNLKALVDAGKFREDLYYRLNGLRIELPGLRERKEDIPLLTQHFLEEIARESRQPVKTLTAEALRLLLSYDWPGNVRELRHFLERTVLLAGGATIEERDCLFDPVIFHRESLAISSGLLLDLEKLPLRAARDGFLKHYLERLLGENGRNVSRAARACGISRESFHRLMKRLKCQGRPGRES
jgi:transcriptional regulator with GAF, ATPase, and Fis domain/serine/threonine protein kinase/tetratricopeptide (TPR) repeat protein